MARKRQAARMPDTGVPLNAQLDAAALARDARAGGRVQALLERARASGSLSARGEQRVLRVARTIADLEGRAELGAQDVGVALALRPLHASQGRAA
jgi:magnesium chelatase family protein